jgi:RNA polymerase sigma-70 factor, ECF subfamily
MTAAPQDEIHEAFVEQFARNEQQIRAFVRSSLPPWADVDDVMQDVGLACWRKFADLEKKEDFRPWACVVARFEVLRHRRKHARDRLVFSEETLALLADVEVTKLDRREKERTAIEACLRKLAAAERTLVLSVHTPGMSVARIARETGQKAKRLYRRVGAIRGILRDCVVQQLAGEC